MQQYSLKFSLNQGYLPEDYIVTEANKEAYQVIMHKQPWGVNPYPNHILLIGPKSSGKTHLAHLWNCMSNQGFASSDRQHIGGIIDNIEEWKELDLLHYFNQRHEEHQPLLMTASKIPHFNLPDLASRINSLRSVNLNMPDEEMVIILLQKHFSARFLKVSVDVIEYISVRIKRDFDYIRKFVEQLDVYSLDIGRNITIPLISKLINNFDD